MRTKHSTAQIVKQVKGKAEQNQQQREKRVVDANDYIPSGSTLLNLSCTDTIDGAFGLGKITNLIGDSASGKTILALSMFAEMDAQKRFDDYTFVYDDIEQSCEFDLEYLFGKDVALRIEKTQTDIECSNTIQECHDNIARALDSQTPFVYVLDSFDALTSEEDQESMDKQRKAREQGKDGAGSYGVAKARYASRMLSDLKKDLKDSNSSLIIISQTRENLNPMSPEKKSRSGGKALKFYSTHEIWLSIIQKMKRTVKGRDRVIGNKIRSKITKNKATGKLRETDFHIYYDYGVDDIRSNIEYLIQEGVWKKTGKKVKAPDFNMEYEMSKLITEIEDVGREKQLIDIVHKTWNDIEESLRLDRKHKYGA